MMKMNSDAQGIVNLRGWFQDEGSENGTQAPEVPLCPELGS